jgi:hypothetical protein
MKSFIPQKKKKKKEIIQIVIVDIVLDSFFFVRIWLSAGGDIH